MTVIKEVEEFVDDVKKGVGNKGFYILIAAAGAFGLYNLLKDNKSSEYVYATGYASYPDVGENSEVVIDSISNEIWASHDEVVGTIESSESEIIQNMDEHFEETNGYIQEGLAAQKEIIQKIEEPKQISGNVYGYVDRQSDGVFVKTDTLSEAFAKANEQEKVVESKTVQIKGTPNTTSTSKSTRSKTSPASKANTTSTKAATSTKKTTSATSPSTYNYTTKKGLDTSKSIVDALKATGADSSMSARKEIAAANGIKNYTGTKAQNTQMLNMMKSGDLVKPTSTKSSGSTKSSSSKSSSKKK